MLSPKRTKFRKAHKGRIHGAAKGGTALNFGAYGLKAVEPGRVTARQIEASRRAITRHMKRLGRVSEFGCNAYVTKPIAYDAFIEAIQRLCGFLEITQLPGAMPIRHVTA